MILAIKCKAGKAFAGCVKEHADEEWKRQELYYQKQGCTVDEVEELKFDKCECEHSKSLKHEFEHDEI